MNVLALGGAGDMGRTAVTTLINSPLIKSITVADRNIEACKKFVALCNSEKATAERIDVTRKNELIDLISRHDLVMSSVGPYYKFGPIIAEACIEARRSCVDICDDWKPMKDILSMHDRAKASGITIIPGIGASPGLSNILAAHAASDLENIDEIVTAWGFGAAVSGPPQPHHVSKKNFESERSGEANAAIVHLLHECSGLIPTFRNNEFVYIDPLSDSAPLNYPGFERTRAYHIGHPEPVTIPRTIKARSVSNVMFYEESFIGLLRKYAGQIFNGTISIQEAAQLLNQNTVTDAAAVSKKNLPPPMFVTASGLKDGRKMTIALGLTRIPYGQMAGSTGVPLAVAALMLADGEINNKGVLTPEETINPTKFLNRFAEYCGAGMTINDILNRYEICH